MPQLFTIPRENLGIQLYFELLGPCSIPCTEGQISDLKQFLPKFYAFLGGNVPKVPEFYTKFHIFPCYMMQLVLSYHLKFD